MSMDGQDQQNLNVEKQNSIGKAIYIGTLGLLSAVLGNAAEVRKLQIYEVKDIHGTGCAYPVPSRAGPATLGVIAIVALLGFRVYCLRTPSPSQEVLLSRFLSWVSWLVAMIFYVVGLLMINNQGNGFRYRDNFQYYYKCNVVKPGIFGAGASFALTTVVLEVVCFVGTQYQTDKTAQQTDKTAQQTDKAAHKNDKTKLNPPTDKHSIAMS